MLPHYQDKTAALGEEIVGMKPTGTLIITAASINILDSLSESVLGLPHGRYAEPADQYKE